jgi:ubiquinone/menaquinone biosynthesis C-methylase UbiE
MEVEPAALTVHAPIYTKDKNELDIDGDFTLRDNFHKKMRHIFSATGFEPRKILDIGCSTGLSTLKLHDSFPKAEIVGMDLSPHMLSGNSSFILFALYDTTRESSLTL